MMTMTIIDDNDAGNNLVNGDYDQYPHFYSNSWWNGDYDWKWEEMGDYDLVQFLHSSNNF